MIDLQLPNFRPPEDFWRFEEVMSEFQKISQKHEEDIKRIVVEDHGHLQKFLITKFKTTNRLEQLLMRIEKYM